MALVKKTVVLKCYENNLDNGLSKGDASGLLKLEFFNGKTHLSLFAVGRAFDDLTQSWDLFVWDEGFDCITVTTSTPRAFEFEINKAFSDTFTALLFNKTCATPILYGSLSPNVKISRFIHYYVQSNTKNTHDDKSQTAELLQSKAVQSASFNSRAESDDQSNPAFDGKGTKSTSEKRNGERIEYDDEAIADCNYYDQSLNNTYEKQTLENNLKDQSQEINDFKGFDNEKSHLSLQNDNATIHNSDQAQAQRQTDTQNDDDSSACPLPIKKQPLFYKNSSERLNSLFNSHAQFLPLGEVVPNSKWIKIEYAKSHYVVGIIYENDIPCYIAYGVPGNRELPPKGFSDYSHFLPNSIFSPSDDGYWCAFQDADSGEIVKG